MAIEASFHDTELVIKQKQKTKQKTTFELPDFYCLRGVIKTKFMMYSGVAQLAS